MLIKMTNAANTALAQAAFTPDSTEQQQRAFLSLFAELQSNSKLSRGLGQRNFAFKFDANDLEEVLVALKKLTKKKIDSYEHNGVLDVTCDIVKDKYRVIVKHDMYADESNVSIQIYTLGA